MSLKLRKLDLHTHTPASHDFFDKSVTAEQIVEHAISVGLDAIAVTDHNTVDFIDIIKEAAKKRSFTIFPGVEISCGGSVNGSIHVIAIFDPSKGKDDLQKILGKLDVKGSGENALTSKSVGDVIEIIRGAGGLSVLAHANSTHGALSDIKGNPRTDVIQNQSLSAVEATAADFKKEQGKRLIDILNGNDVVYKRKLPVYKSSDNRSPDGKGHSLAAIGSQYTYFKMGNLSLEALRQCFEDPDSRIIQDYEAEKLQSDHSRLETLTISGGFLGSQVFNFHSGMNSIIGGTGTGKSLVVEFLRFAFDKKPNGVLLKEHVEKLNKQLRLGGEVKVIFKDRSGDEYELLRKYGSSRDPYSSPPVCKNLTTGKEFKGDISSIFPLLIYSQNEILEITRDAKAQLSLLDNFRDFASYQNQLIEIKNNLEKLDSQLVQAIQGSANLVALKKQQENIDEKLQKLEKKLNAKGSKASSATYITLSEQRASIESKIDEFDQLLDRIDELIDEFETDTPSSKSTPKATIEIIESEIAKRYKSIIGTLRKNRSDIEAAKQKANKLLSDWEKSINYKELEKKYTAELAMKKAEQAQETERRGLLKDKKELAIKITTADKAAKTIPKLRGERDVLLSKLGRIKSDYYKERVKQAELITEKSGNKLKILVHQDEDKNTYTQMLSKLKVGTHAEKKEIETIVNTLQPVELVNLVLDNQKKELAKKTKITEQKAENIIKELSSRENLLQALALQYQGKPDDSVEIQYQKKDKSYYELSELSMGQKADALIMIALGDGVMPVIIDQPEDALDIPSIWTDICTRLRIGKHARQFIFTTHNSSISVSSDSDQFIVLEADGSKGWICQAGSIEVKRIKDEVVGHLEGGYDSYDLKRKKYGL
jgi:DNA repair ATPase RecN